MRIPFKKIGKYVGRAVGKEAGIIPDTTQLEFTPEQREDFVQAIAEGVYAALKQAELERREQAEEDENRGLRQAVFAARNH